MEAKLDKRLWQAIQASYDDRNYTGAILDALHFLGDLIREKTGLESDGIALVGQAFGGKKPRLKVTKLQTDSDWNLQRGIEQLLRGIYQGIRNPRSHEKHSDSAGNAEAIILFVNYLLQVIDQSKSHFDKGTFLDRVFDKEFVESDRYAQLMVAEIPKKQRLNIFVDVFRLVDTGETSKLKYFLSSLLNEFDGDERAQVYALVSDQMKHTDSEAEIRLVVQVFASSWKELNEAARMRVENRLIRSIADGRYSSYHGRLTSGSLGTWIRRIAAECVLKDELVEALIAKLDSSERDEQEYVSRYLFSILMTLVPVPTGRLTRVITNGLKSGNRLFHSALSWIIEVEEAPPWVGAFKESYDQFVEAEPKSAMELLEDGDNDLPF